MEEEKFLQINSYPGVFEKGRGRFEVIDVFAGVLENMIT